MKSLTRIIMAALLLPFCLQINAVAADKEPENPKQAIVMAAFGTSVPKALNGIINIRDQIQKAYPETKVHLAFTSSIIRSIWQDRREDSDFKNSHPGIPADITEVKGVLATIADLQDQGYKTILVQSTHMSLGEEYLDLVTLVSALSNISPIKKRNTPFYKLVTGRPAMGTMGITHPYVQDIEQVAMALTADAALAEETGAALVYMGHGNDYFPSGGAYLQFADIMNHLYPGIRTYIGTVEGFPSLDNVLEALKKDGIEKIILKPFMTVAGDHAMNDMAGSEDDSWKSILEDNGFQVNPVMQGLGESDSFADVFVSHLADLAQDHNIILK